MKSKSIFFFLFAHGSFMSAQTINRNTVDGCAGKEVFSFFRATAFVIVFLSCTLLVNAQLPRLTLGNIGVCENSTVLVPLTGLDLVNVGAITIFIDYDDQSLSFNSIENIDPQMSGLIYNSLSNPSRIAVVWTKTSGINFTNTTLLNIKFNVLHKSGIINFAKENCEIANASIPPQIISVNYTDGSIFAAAPTISAEPENKTVPSHSNVVFEVSSPDASGFTWQESRNSGTSWYSLSENDIYSGTHTTSLTIIQVPANYNKFNYRCVLNPGSCPVVSTSALLSVDSVSGFNGSSSKSILQLNNTPNPFSATTTLGYTVPEAGFVTLKIFSMTGQIMGVPVASLHQTGSYRVEENFVYLPAGIYFCQFVFKGSTGVYETYRKMIKTN